ncbi:MAG: hypothetical protein CL912_27700 [Deltaproteobacteria bacterium]|nr:hypothetical protein [Deltaproteobacteria bacterium]
MARLDIDSFCGSGILAEALKLEIYIGRHFHPNHESVPYQRSQHPQFHHTLITSIKGILLSDNPPKQPFSNGEIISLLGQCVNPRREQAVCPTPV